MLGYRRRSFDKVHTLLREIARAPKDIVKVLLCQRILLQEILRAEAHIIRHKSALRTARTRLKTSRPEKSEAKRLKRYIGWVEGRIEAYQQLTYIWRCFGDGIAFSYLDKYAIKHAFYETETVAVKQGGGFISGKEGLADEIMLVEAAAKAGVPSILVDLTNSMRHGDVCLLGGPDPYLIEVKGGSRLNDRGRRQVSAIEKLHAFYETDVASDFRGYPELRRVAPGIPERCYAEKMNECIARAERAGLCVINPEPGLYYGVIHDARGAVKAMLDAMPVESPLVFVLNQYKSNRTWPPYRPFTLAIEKAHHLYKFIKGEIFLVVVLDVAKLCGQLAEQGFEATFGESIDYPLRYRHPKTDGTGGISANLLQRVALEFVSPRWIIDCQVSAVERWHTNLSANEPSADTANLPRNNAMARNDSDE